jgi:hypothetical protein
MGQAKNNAKVTFSFISGLICISVLVWYLIKALL